MENEITLEELYNDLEKYKDFDADSKNCEKFLETVDKIVLKGDPSSIHNLVKYFDDKTEYGWVMTGMRKSMENFPPYEYTVGIIKEIPTLVSNAMMYSDEIVNAILNSSVHRKFFRDNLFLASRNYLLKLFAYMEVESPHHDELLREFKGELDRYKR